MFKKLLSRTLAASALTTSLMLCASTTARAADGDEFTDGNLKFIVLSEEAHTVALSGYVEKPVGELVIPSQANNGTTDYTVTRIAERSLGVCEELTSVTIPNTVTSIGWRSFAYCYKLEHIEIPNSVTEIEFATFDCCSSLKSITLPNSLKEISASLFSYCTLLESVTIPENLELIGGSAFYQCGSLSDIEFPETLTEIGSSAFSGCEGLTTLRLPKSLTKIGYYAFSGCKGVTSLELPESELSIGNGAFAGCIGITSLDIPETIISIGSTAFTGTGITSLVLPAGFYEIWGGAFSGCRSLDNISIAEGDSNYLTIDGVLFDKNGHLVSFPGARKEYIVPDFCVELKGEAFYSCTNLERIELPNTLTFMGTNSFGFCESLKSIIIPNSITYIDNKTFYGCSSLTTLTIPEGVWTLQSECLAWCESLKNLYILSKLPPVVSWKPIENEDITIYIPEGSLEDYTSAEHWSEFTNYVEMPPFTLALDEELTVEMGQTGVLTVQIEKADDVTVESERWLSFNSEVATVDENGVVTGVAEGTALIACTVVDSFGCDHREFCKVTVTPTSGIGSIEATATDTPAVYYNLNGVRVDGNALAPGFYIKRQGTKAEKILVK